jgi:hypothetical protein
MSVYEIGRRMVIDEDDAGVSRARIRPEERQDASPATA